MASSVARYVSSYHLCSGSFNARMEILWKSVLKFAYPDNYSKIVGDSFGLQLMAILMLISIKTQNTFLSWTCSASFVAHSEAKFATSRKSVAIKGNWLLSGNYHTTNTIERKTMHNEMFCCDNVPLCSWWATRYIGRTPNWIVHPLCTGPLMKQLVSAHHLCNTSSLLSKPIFGWLPSSRGQLCLKWNVHTTSWQA